MTKAKKVHAKSGIKWEVCIYTNGKGSKRIKRRFDRKVDADYFIKNFSSLKNKSFVREEKVVRTFKTEAKFWLSVRGEEISPSHLVRVRGILTYLLPEFGDYPLERINNSFLADLRRELMSRSLKPATINRWTNVLTTIVNFSFKHNRIESNPCFGFGLLTEFREE
ncbi:MAG: hypothetical protein WD025_08740, partial [Bacteriovoracaceae bacterium]